MIALGEANMPLSLHSAPISLTSTDHENEQGRNWDCLHVQRHPRPVRIKMSWTSHRSGVTPALQHCQQGVYWSAVTSMKAASTPVSKGDFRLNMLYATLLCLCMSSSRPTGRQPSLLARLGMLALIAILRYRFPLLNDTAGTNRSPMRQK